jgi:hypothetical protein
MMTMQFHEPFTNDQTEPKQERQFRICEAVLQTLGHLQKRVLYHVSGIDASLQPAVHAHVHHAPQPILIECEDVVEGGRFPGAGPPQQVVNQRRGNNLGGD